MSDLVLCSKCPRPAHWYLREGLMCVHCGTLTLTRNMIAEMERCIIPANSVSPNIPGECAAALTLAGSQGLGGTAAVISACTSLEASPGSSSSDLAVGLDGTPAQERPSTFFNRSSTTMFRVAAASAIQDSVSSDIPNHHQ